MKLTRTTPVLRILDYAGTCAFYVDFLGFSVDWEHRFEDGMPVYMQVSRDACALHLCEHQGAGSPGAALRIETDDLDALHAELSAGLSSGDDKFECPGIVETPWGTRDLKLTDPFGNKLTFTNLVE